MYRIKKKVFKKSRNTFYRERNDINRKVFTHARTQFNNAKKRAKKENQTKGGI